MSLAEPQQITEPDLALIEAVESSIACQWHTIVNPPEQECPNQATFQILFKDQCDHGEALPGDPEPLVCGSHAAWFVRGDYACGACKCAVDKCGGWKHLITSFREI
jgi:hypothetical protein